MITVLFSYAHEDQRYRDELEKHLAMLKRQELIDAWHDRRIGAGVPIDSEISRKLEAAEIVLLLVSPDFLASDYCYEREMARALERHKSGEAVVIPVILRPCDWHSAPFSHLRATPPDGKPVSKFPNIDDAYLAVGEDVREAVERVREKKGSKAPLSAHDTGPKTRPKRPRSSNLRVKRDFSDKEKDDFVESTFEYIANYFESSLEELRGRTPGLEAKFQRVDTQKFTVSIYRTGARRGFCRISLSSTLGGKHRAISYSSSDADRDGSFNELLHVKDDGYSLLIDGMMPSMTSEAKAHMTQEGAAEHLWSMFIEPLQ